MGPPMWPWRCGLMARPVSGVEWSGLCRRLQHLVQTWCKSAHKSFWVWNTTSFFIKALTSGYRTLERHSHSNLHSNEYGSWKWHLMHANFDQLCQITTVSSKSVTVIVYLTHWSQMGHGCIRRCWAHAVQQIRWPHGKNTVLTLATKHTLHDLCSLSLLFSSRIFSSVTIQITWCVNSKLLIYATSSYRFSDLPTTL